MANKTKNTKAIAGATGSRLSGDLLRARRIYHEQVILNNIGVTNTNDVTVNTFKAMSRNPTIKMGLALLKSPVCGVKREILSDTPAVQEFFETYITPQMDDIITNMLQCMDIGFSVSEMLWKDVRYNSDLLIYPYQFELIDPTDIIFLKDEGDYAGIKVDSVEVDGNKTLYTVWEGLYGNLYGTAITRPSFEAWRSLQYAQLNADRHFEQQGSPVPEIYYPDDVDDEGNYTYKGDAEAIAQGISSTGAVVLPKKAEENEKVWEISYLEGNTSGDNFISYMTYLDTLLLRGVLIPDGTATRSGSETGSYAERSAAIELLSHNLDEISQWIDRGFQKQVIDRVVEANFPGANVYIKSEPVSDIRKELLYELTKRVIDGKNATETTREIADEIYKRLAEDVVI